MFTLALILSTFTGPGLDFSDLDVCYERPVQTRPDSETRALFAAHTSGGRPDWREVFGSDGTVIVCDPAQHRADTE